MLDRIESISWRFQFEVRAKKTNIFQKLQFPILNINCFKLQADQSLKDKKQNLLNLDNLYNRNINNQRSGKLVPIEIH
jgi:hypothetical protein